MRTPGFEVLLAITAAAWAASACGSTPKSTATPTNQPTDGSARTVDGPPPCPEKVALGGLLATAWQLTPEQTIEVAVCAPGRFGGVSAWFAIAWIDVGPEDAVESTQRMAVLAAEQSGGGAILAQSEGFPVPPWYRFEGFGGSASAQDFDDDGVDEIMVTEGQSHGGTEHEDVTVYRVVDGQLVSVFSQAIGYDDIAYQEDELATTSCSAQVEVTQPLADNKRHLIITGKVEQGPHADPANASECLRGRSEFVLSGPKFEKL